MCKCNVKINRETFVCDKVTVEGSTVMLSTSDGCLSKKILIPKTSGNIQIRCETASIGNIYCHTGMLLLQAAVGKVYSSKDVLLSGSVNDVCGGQVAENSKYVADSLRFNRQWSQRKPKDTKRTIIHIFGSPEEVRICSSCQDLMCETVVRGGMVEELNSTVNVVIKGDIGEVVFTRTSGSLFYTGSKSNDNLKLLSLLEAIRADLHRHHNYAPMFNFGMRIESGILYNGRPEGLDYKIIITPHFVRGSEYYKKIIGKGRVIRNVKEFMIKYSIPVMTVEINAGERWLVDYMNSGSSYRLAETKLMNSIRVRRSTVDEVKWIKEEAKKVGKTISVK